MFPQQPELSVPAAVGLMLVALVVNLATVLVVLHLANRLFFGRSRPSSGGEAERRPSDAATGAASDAPEGRSVRCRECETANDPEYRYCRECVARLPGGASTTRREMPSFGRFAD